MHSAAQSFSCILVYYKIPTCGIIRQWHVHIAYGGRLGKDNNEWEKVSSNPYCRYENKKFGAITQPLVGLQCKFILLVVCVVEKSIPLLRIQKCRVKGKVFSVIFALKIVLEYCIISCLALFVGCTLPENVHFNHIGYRHHPLLPFFISR